MSVPRSTTTVVRHNGSLADLQAYVHDWAKRLGWWDQDVEKDRSLGAILALIHSEISEALEELRDGHEPDEVYVDEKGKPQGFGIELADALIRILDTCERYGIDLQACFDQKMAYNETRSWRHGGKRL